MINQYLLEVRDRKKAKSLSAEKEEVKVRFGDAGNKESKQLGKYLEIKKVEFEKVPLEIGEKPYVSTSSGMVEGYNLTKLRKLFSAFEQALEVEQGLEQENELSL